LTSVLTVAGKDLRSELRGKEAINASVSFALVILLIFSFVFEPTEQETKAISGGLLWIAFAFAGALVLNRSFARELPNDCLDVLVASPAPGWQLFLGKSIASFILLIGIEFLCLPVFGIFYGVVWYRSFWPLVLVLALGTWAMTILGVSFAALTVNVRLRELMLPLLLYPALSPALMASMQLTTVLIAGQSISGDAGGSAGGNNDAWLRLLIGFDIIYTALALTLVEFVLVL
jgi:heme exporter protein B